MKANDNVINHLKNITLNVYNAELRKRQQEINSGKEPKCEFLLQSIKKALKQDLEDLKKSRKMNVDELASLGSGSTEKNAAFTKNLGITSTKLQNTKKLSMDLHATASEISTDFSSITDQLDFTTSLVSKAEEMKINIRFIQEFNKNDENSALKKRLSDAGFPENKHAQAELLSKLIKIVQNAEMEKMSTVDQEDKLKNAKANLEKYREDLTKSLLEEFNKDPPQPVVQSVCANSLAYLQNAYQAVDAYIKKTPLLNESTNNIKYNDAILDMQPSEQMERYQHLCKFFYEDCKKSWSDIDIIFDKNQQPKTALVQKVWIEVFAPFVINVLNDAEEKDPERYCRMLFDLYNETISMMNNIWAINDQVFSASNIIDETFRPFQIQYELKENENIMNKMNEVVTPSILRFKAYIDKSKKVTLFKNDEVEYDVFEDFNPGIPISILKEGASAWERCIVLALPSKMHAVLNTLIDIIIQSNLRDYMTNYLLACQEYMKKDSADLSLVSKYLTVTATFNTVILTLDEKYNTILKKALSMKHGYQEQFLQNRDTLMRSFEDSITKGLQRCIDITLKTISAIVSTKQYKNQYINLREAFISNACMEVCKIIGSPGKGIIGYIEVLSTENRMSFAAVLTRGILDVLVKAMKEAKYEYPFGVISLSLEVNAYKTAFSYFNLPSLNKKLDDIEAAVKLMNARPENMQDTKVDLALDEKTLKFATALIALRTDAKENDLVAKLM